MVGNNFKFINPGKLIDGELELFLVKKIPANPKKEYFPVYKFKMMDKKINQEVGIVDLRIGFNDNIRYGGHIGYTVYEKYRGNHYAARSCKLLFPLAKEHNINPLTITCNPENMASRKTCELAGGKLIEIVDLPQANEQYKEGDRQKCRYQFDL